MKVAVDAMGGDYAPESVIKGALLALKELENLELVLVGDEERINSEIKSQSLFRFHEYPLSIVHAPEVIEMSDSPVEALKKKKNSSIVVMNKLLSEGKVEAVVSAGNTGAMFASSSVACGRIKGVNRPTIGTILPNKGGACLLIDAGANIDCKPEHLLQFGIIGSLFIKFFLDIPNPKVGLLNIGEESSKGIPSTVAAYALLKASHLNFIGNVEGGDVFSGEADVVVCDGFVGNILLKFAEGIASMVKYKIEDKLKHIPGITKMMSYFEKDFDYQQYGGVPILGINGVSIICHGHSSPKAIKNAIGESMRLIEMNFIDKIKNAVEKFNEENGA
ncbi:phosphate acyltransferase PlsX [candidate division KSB1 bacterium]